jgi:hypothetical protein
MDLNESIMRWVDSRELNVLTKKAKVDGWVIYELDGTKISDRNDFYRMIASVIPMDPPLSGKGKWDALSDSLWGGLALSPDSKVLLIWKNAVVMARANPSDFETAKDILFEVAEPLSNQSNIQCGGRLVRVLLGSE